MDELTILSPHRDDAAFSVCLSMARWRDLGRRLRVVNFFTTSAYGPRTGSADKGYISFLRKREDQRVLSRIDRAIMSDSLELLDAPLRLGIDVNSVCRPETGELLRNGEREKLAFQIGRYLKRGLVLSPLGVGNHVDHLAVRTAAALSSSGRRLGFYEDIPYATWTPAPVLGRIVCEIEHVTRVPLKPVIIRARKGVRWKGQIIAGYGSQISLEQATRMAQFALTYRGCERIWIPKHAKDWQPLTA